MRLNRKCRRTFPAPESCLAPINAISAWPSQTLRSFTAILLTCFLVACVSASASAVVITFDHFPGPDGKLGTLDDVPIIAPFDFVSQNVQLTNQFQSVGVRFLPSTTVQDKNEILANDTFTMPPGTTEPNLLASSGALTIDGEVTTPVSSVGVLVTAGPDQLEIFSAGGTSLGSISGSNTFLSLGSATPVARFRVTAVAGSITPGIDNLTFVFVPEPSALVLAAVGLACLGSLRRFRPGG